MMGNFTNNLSPSSDIGDFSYHLTEKSLISLVLVSLTPGKKEASGWTGRNILTPICGKKEDSLIRLSQGELTKPCPGTRFVKSFLSHVYMSTDGSMLFSQLVLVGKRICGSAAVSDLA